MTVLANKHGYVSTEEANFASLSSYAWGWRSLTGE